MALKYSCPLCGTEYDAEITTTGVVYMVGNIRTKIEKEIDPCQDCKKEISKAEEEAKERIKQAHGKQTEAF